MKIPKLSKTSVIPIACYVFAILLLVYSIYQIVLTSVELADYSKLYEENFSFAEKFQYFMQAGLDSTEKAILIAMTGSIYAGIQNILKKADWTHPVEMPDLNYSEPSSEEQDAVISEPTENKEDTDSCDND